jgi:membrane fusion protein (multidrug efflux system)
MMAGLKRIAMVVGLIVLLLPAGYFVWRWYDLSRDIQSTNDAYVRGEITDMSSRVSGYAVEVLFDDGMAGQSDRRRGADRPARFPHGGRKG